MIKKEKCILCGKKTQKMVSMNRGLYCMKHWEIGAKQQETDLKLDELKGMITPSPVNWEDRPLKNWDEEPLGMPPSPTKEGKCLKCGRTSNVVNMKDCPFCNPLPAKWEIEFDKLTLPLELSVSEIWHEYTKDYHKKIKSFISNLLSSHRESVIEECMNLLPEKIDKDYSLRKNVLAECAWDSGFNQAIQEIKIKLKFNRIKK